MAKREKKLYEDILVPTAKAALKEFDWSDGTFPGGHNGPHGHKETPVRNTSHWLVTFIKAYELSENKDILKAIEQGRKYLLSDKIRPHGYTFHCRKTKSKNNGLIGQAWVIEALAILSNHFECEKCQKLAKKVFFLHPFSEKYGLWRRRGVEGQDQGYDLTLNHQIWFAAASSLLEDEDILERVRIFLENLSQHMILSDQGYVCMPINHNSFSGLKKIEVMIRSSGLYRFLRTGQFPDKLEKFTVGYGYHAFHLYGLAMLQEEFPENQIWEKEVFTNALEFVFERDFINNVIKSRYGLGYNPPGLEVAYSLYKFQDLLAGKFARKEIILYIKAWLSFQFNKTYSFEEKLMNLNQEDPITYAARVYEASRLPDFVFEKYDHDLDQDYLASRNLS